MKEVKPPCCSIIKYIPLQQGLRQSLPNLLAKLANY